jgi:sugar phosphate isomerase/epimerase
MNANFENRRVFVSTACIPIKESVRSRISSYRQCGLDAIELGASVSVNEEDLAQIAEVQCNFLVHNYFPPPQEPFVLNLASQDDDIRQRSLDLVFKALDLTVQLGAPFYSVHAGFITDPTSFGTTSFVFPMPTSSSEKQAAVTRFKASLEKVSSRAQELSLQTLVENNVCTEDLRGKLLFQTADEILGVFHDLSLSNLGLLLDTGHLNVTAHTFDFDRMRFVERVAPYVRAFHISDNDGTEDKGEPVREGSWVLDVLHRPEFIGLPVVVEAHFDNTSELCQYVDWLKEELEI